MKQVFTGKHGIEVAESPVPALLEGTLLIRVAYSCISAGTEMNSVKAAEKSLFQKACENPQKIMQVLNILRAQGLKAAQSKISSASEKLTPTGYSLSGTVLAVGSGVDGFQPGDKVAAGGAGFAVHAGFVAVPRNLVVKLSFDYDLRYAACGTIGSIAMQGVRRASLNIGENAVVIGVGLIGLLTLQILRAAGVHVACVDINESRLNLARRLGAEKTVNSAAENPVDAILNWQQGYGSDAVLFTAATSRDEPLSQAFQMCRRKGRVVLVGVSGMNIRREDIYQKEIDFLISTSYGPGRYDSSYESKGIDYPYAYVRWTENRNISSFLELVHEKKVDIDALSPSVYPVEEAENAYKALRESPENHIVTLFDFHVPEENSPRGDFLNLHSRPAVSPDCLKIGLIGAGNFATSTLLPIIAAEKSKFHLKTVVNNSGFKAVNAANIFGGENAAASENAVLDDPEVDLVMICTRHNNHAELVLKALERGKNVYVEKPLAVNAAELTKIEEFYKNAHGGAAPILTVGYNRRFSPCMTAIKKALDQRSAPVFLHYRMNAGWLAADQWAHEDGGRIIGEGCHLVDLMRFLAGSEILSVQVGAFHPLKGRFFNSDNRSVTLEFKDGSLAVIDYFACGSRLLPKESMEMHFENKSILMEDYQKVTGYGVKMPNLNSLQPEKGHKEEWLGLYRNLRAGTWPIPLNELLETSRISLIAGGDC